MKTYIGFLLLFLLSLPALAGGPFYVDLSGNPIAWDGSIALHPESGACATYTNGQMISRLRDNIDYWAEVPLITLSFSVITGTLGSDVDANNVNDYIDETTGGDAEPDDQISPVIFDDDGEITSLVFGAGNEFAVLGFAGPAITSETQAEFTDGLALFNCRCLDRVDLDDCESGGSTITFTEDDLDFTMVHEIGHLIGLDHTQINQSLASSCSTSVEGDCDALPTMFPVSVDAADQISPQRDDEVSVLSLYGLAAMQEATCTVTGIIRDNSGDPMRCADIQAETTDETNAIGVVSGVFAPLADNNDDGDYADAGDCESDCGTFTLRGLDPSLNYTLTVRPIYPLWVEGSGINPCYLSQRTGIEEETIATITAGDCPAGETLDLGSIETNSDPSDGDSGSSSGGSTGGTTSGSSAVIGPLCSLNLHSVVTTSGWFFLILPFLASSFLKRRRASVNPASWDY